MEYYVRECGDILGVSNKLAADTRDAKHILEYIFAQVAEFKKLNQVRTNQCCFNMVLVLITKLYMQTFP